MAEIDVRDPGANLLTPQREAELRQEAARLSNTRGFTTINIERFDPVTGNPSRITLTPPVPTTIGSDNPVTRSLAYVQDLGSVLGLSQAQAPEFRANPNPQRTSSGAIAVQMRQHYKAIPIFQSAAVVHYAPDGSLTEILTTVITVRRDLRVVASMLADAAVFTAAEHVAEEVAGDQGNDPFGQPIPSIRLDISGFEPRLTALFAGQPDRPTVFEAGPFARPLKASLLWFYIAPEIRLTWMVDLATGDPARPSAGLVEATVLVDTEGDGILYSRLRR